MHDIDNCRAGVALPKHVWERLLCRSAADNACHKDAHSTAQHAKQLTWTAVMPFLLTNPASASGPSARKVHSASAAAATLERQQLQLNSHTMWSAAKCEGGLRSYER